MKNEKPEVAIAVRQKMAVEAVAKKIAETLWVTEKRQGDIDWPSHCVKAGRAIAGRMTGCELCSDKCPNERKIGNDKEE
jgi:hypothetical protein